jgi:hypothetical protein
MPRVYGSVTNNNGFWIGWLDLLTASFTVTHNHNQLQELAINLQSNPCSLTVEDSLHSGSRSTTDFWFTTGLLIQSRGGSIKNIRCPAMDTWEPHRKHRFLYCYIYSVLHRNGSYPIVACLFVVAYCCRLYLATVCLPRICLLGNVFIVA